MKKEKSIRNDSIRISHRNANKSLVASNRKSRSDNAVQSIMNSRADFVNSSHNDGNSSRNDNPLNKKIKTVLAAFVLLEVLDAALTFFGISQRGLVFEKNLFVRNFIMSYGFIVIATAKIFFSAAFALMINYLYAKTKNYRRILFYTSVLLMLIALYGAGSGVYVLFFYP